MEQYTLAALIFLTLTTIVKELISWFKERSLQNQAQKMSNLEESLEKMQEELGPALKNIKELHEWHDKSDEDGVKIWYIRKSLENVLRENAQAVAVLAKNSELQTNLLKEILESQKVIVREQIFLANELKIHIRNREE